MNWNSIVLAQSTLFSVGSVFSSNHWTGVHFLPSDPEIYVTLNPDNPNATRQKAIGSPFVSRGCGNIKVKLEALASGSGTLTYEWIDVVSGSLLGTGASLTVPLIEGQYFVKVSDNTGSIFSSTIVQLCLETGPPRVSLRTSGATTLCLSGAPTTLTLTADAQNPNPSLFCADGSFIYQWFKDNVLLPNETGANIQLTNQADNAGRYTVRVANTCGLGANSTATLEIRTTNSSPLQVSLSSADGSNALCPNGSLVLRADAGGLVDSYQWFRNNTPIALGTSNSLTITTGGSYRVRAINGCGFNDSPVLTIGSTTAPAQILIDVFPPDGIFCQNDVGFLIPNVLSGGQVERFELYRNNGLYATAPDAGGFLVSEIGTYKIRAINKCGNVESNPINMGAIVAPTFVRIAPQGSLSLSSTCVPPTNSVVLEAVSDGTQLTYEWFLNNVSILGASNAILNANAIGQYQVVVSNNCNMVSSASVQVIQVNSPPPTNISISSGGIFSTCDGGIDLTCNNFGNGTSYEWLLNSSIIARTTSPNFRATQSGNYAVKARNACGESNVASSLALTIGNAPNLININAPQGFSSCQAGGALSLNFTPEAGINYQWFRDGQVIVGATNSSLITSLSGSYTVQATNACTTVESSPVDLVFFVPPQSGEVLVNLNPCETPLSLSVQTSANFLSYQWYRIHNNTLNLVGTQATYTPTLVGAYFVRVRNVCLPIGVWVSSPPVQVSAIGGSIALPEPIVNGPTTTICPNTQVKLTAQVSNASGLNYRWFKNNQLIPNQSQNELTVSESGEYTVEVFSPNNPNCARTSLPFALFYSPPPALLLSFNGNQTFCEGDSIQLVANFQIQPAQFSWFKDNQLLNTNIRTIYAKTAGNYRLEARYTSATVSFPCALTTATELLLNTSPQPQPRIVADGFRFRSLDEGALYQWNINGIPILGAESRTHLPLDSGRYSVTVTNEAGCVGTSEEIYSLGIYLGTTDPLRVAPNPNDGNFYITVVSENISTISLYDSMGKIIFENQSVDKENSIGGFAIIRVNQLTPGIYLLRAYGDGNYITKKVLVRW
ncbi:MAG: T9SS type A sorting domain-containing protein [Microscillaceae bacterium]|nr:T9SS type A sorting domain-containing protein [Microscillaceae bacterium]